MKYKIVADSSCDLTNELKNKLPIEFAPLTLQIGDQIFRDDETLNIKEYIKAMKDSPVAPKTACPSPDEFYKRYEGDEIIFGVTLTKELSGTYNSAVLAKEMYLEDHPDKFIHIFNSRSASVGEALIALKIQELMGQGYSPEEIVEKVEAYISEMRTFFLLESLTHLAKAGRLNPVIAKIATVLHLKPIMGATPEGTIKLVHKVRGYNKAFERLIETIGEHGNDFSDKTLAISYCNCPERALTLKKAVEERYNFKNIIIVEMGGLSTTYADDGGIIIAW